MKQYVIDQLRPNDYFKIKAYLDMNLRLSGIPDIYWLILPQEMLEGNQAEHADCQPLYFALELSQSALSCELLVRTLSHVRCDCMRYASLAQRNWLIQTIDDICDQLA
ncbi:MAG: hypothetical protein WCR46_21895 [Deltaproteobacteria bacterium]|jgi:hypothetical protein